MNKYTEIKTRRKQLMGLPWKLGLRETGYHVLDSTNEERIVLRGGGHRHPAVPEEMEFIIHAPNDIDYLLAEVERLAQQLDLMVSVHASGQRARRRAEQAAEVLTKKIAQLSKELTEAKQSLGRLTKERDEEMAMAGK